MQIVDQFNTKQGPFRNDESESLPPSGLSSAYCACWVECLLDRVKYRKSRSAQGEPVYFGKDLDVRGFLHRAVKFVGEIEAKRVNLCKTQTRRGKS
jgi:hypothetical protein